MGLLKLFHQLYYHLLVVYCPVEQLLQALIEHVLLHATCRPEPHDFIISQFYLAVYFLQLLLVLFVEKFHVLCQQCQQFFIDA